MWITFCQGPIENLTKHNVYNCCMRIGFFTDGYLPQPNGVATSVYETAKELERRGHEVFVIAPKYPGYKDTSKNVIRLTSINVNEAVKIRVAITLPDKDMRQVLSNEYDIIHGHAGGPITLLGWEVARNKKVPYVVTYHTMWSRYTHYFLKGKVVTPKMMERATKIFGNAVDFLIAPTGRVEKELRSYGVKTPIKVIPSGVDLEEFAKAKKGVLRKRLGLKNEPIVLFVGRLGKEKMTDFIIKSFSEVLLKEPKAQLVIAGDGEERDHLEGLCGNLKIDENVHFLGDTDQSKMREIYKDADVFVFASKTETQGLVVPEALAAGLPVVVNNDPAFDYIENGHNGFRVDLKEDEFASKILEIIKSPDKGREMSKNAQESAQKFSIKTAVDSLEASYFDLLEKANRESVTQIMKENARSENLFVVDVAFWASVLSSRIWFLLFPPADSEYPTLSFSNQSFGLAAIGLLIFLIGFAAFAAKRSSGLFSLIFMGAGVGLVISELWSLLFSSGTLLGYWNPFNVLPVLLVGLVPLIFIRTKTSDRPKFYINVPPQKHINPERPHASIVVPAYNEGEFIEPTLKSLLNQTYKNFELVVVDNNSTDNTAEISKKYGARVILAKEKGVAHARQTGFMAAKGQIIASIDADSVAPENWLEKIVEAYSKNEKLAGFGGLNYLYSGPVTARVAGRFLFPIFWKIDRFVNGGWNLVGFNMSVRKIFFEKIGGFNAGLAMGEDVDLSQRLRTVGQVGINPKLLVYSSGRRFRSGLISGVSSYAPYWISKMVLHKDKPFEFKDVRSEDGKTHNFGYLPVSLAVVLLFAVFYLAIN